MNNNVPQQFPPFRQVPTWNPNDVIEVKGFEWEAIQNGLVNMQLAQQAAQSVMSRNLITGKITMDFLKLNSETLQYEPMTADEKQPLQADFQRTIDAFKAQQAAAEKVAQNQKTVQEPKAEIVDANGDPFSKATGVEVIDVNAETVEVKPKRKPGKVVKMTPKTTETAK